MGEPGRARLLRYLEHLKAEELQKFKFALIPHIPRGLLEGAERARVADLLVTYKGEQKAWELTQSIWEKMGLRELLEQAQEEDLGSVPAPVFPASSGEKKKYQERMREKFQFMSEKNSRPGERKLFQHQFTELLLLPEYRYKEEKQHELFIQGWKHAQVIEERGQRIEVSALFDPDPKTGVQPRTVVLHGAAGIGKSTLAIKVILDWTEGKLYQERFNYVFYFSCREMNSLGERTISFANLILTEWPGPQAPMLQIMSHPERLLFIIDGLDELRFPCNEHRYDLCRDWKEKRPVCLLLSSLLRKTLLPEASLLLTTRLAALGKFSPLLENPRHVEILGFSVDQRREYFYKFFSNKYLGEKAFRLVARNAPLFTMCSVPLMNWIVCTCLKQQEEKGRDPMQALKTTTALYTCYISAITCDDKKFVPEHLRNLCHLAAEGIWEKKLLFEVEDLRRHDLEPAEVSAFLDMNIFQKDSDYENCYSFIHLSFQQFFAALFYVMSTGKDGVKIPDSSIPDVKQLLEECSGKDSSFVELVVRFLFGFLNAETATELERKFRYRMLPEIKSQLLQWAEGQNQGHYCQFWYSTPRIPLCYFFLYETQDAAFSSQVLDNIQEFRVKVENHYQALAAVFCMKHCLRARRIFFTCLVYLPDDVWQDFYSVVSKNQNLKELFMYPRHSDYPLENICVELRKANCKLEKLTLVDSTVTYASFQGLCSIPTLKSLHLYNIKFEADDMKLPQETLEENNCQLQTLRFQTHPYDTNDIQKFLSALKRNQSLKNLDIRYKGLWKKEEFNLLCNVLRNPGCKIETLRLDSFQEKPEYFQKFCSALNSNESLKNLDLGYICFDKDEKINLLCNVLENPGCKIETLRFVAYYYTLQAIENFCSALKRNQSLKNLDLGNRWFQKEEFNILSNVLENPDCKIETLRLQYLYYDPKWLQNLCSALYSNESVKNLDLSEIRFKEEEDVNLLCKVLGKPKCKIEMLRLFIPDASLSCIQDLLHVICSSESLKTLALDSSFWDDERKKLLCEVLEDQNNKVQTLILSLWNLREASVKVLTSLKPREGLHIIWEENQEDTIEFSEVS